MRAPLRPLRLLRRRRGFVIVLTSDRARLPPRFFAQTLLDSMAGMLVAMKKICKEHNIPTIPLNIEGHTNAKNRADRGAPIQFKLSKYRAKARSGDRRAAVVGSCGHARVSGSAMSGEVARDVVRVPCWCPKCQFCWQRRAAGGVRGGGRR